MSGARRIHALPAVNSSEALFAAASEALRDSYLRGGVRDLLRHAVASLYGLASIGRERHESHHPKPIRCAALEAMAGDELVEALVGAVEVDARVQKYKAIVQERSLIDAVVGRVRPRKRFR